MKEDIPMIMKSKLATLNLNWIKQLHSKDDTGPFEGKISVLFDVSNSDRFQDFTELYKLLGDIIMNTRSISGISCEIPKECYSQSLELINKESESLGIITVIQETIKRGKYTWYTFKSSQVLGLYIITPFSEYEKDLKELSKTIASIIEAERNIKVEVRHEKMFNSFSTADVKTLYYSVWSK